MLPYTSQIAVEASFFFSITLFRAWFHDNQFSKIKTQSSEHSGGVPVTYSCYVSKVAGIHSPI